MRRRHLIAVGVFIALLAIVFALSPRSTRQIQSSVLRVVSPLLRGGSQWKSSAQKFVAETAKLSELEKANDELELENARLKILLQHYEGLQEENDRYRQLLGFEKRSVFKLEPARILYRKTTSWWSTIVIDKGYRDQLGPGMPVVTYQGLVGQVSSVGADTAIVILLTEEKLRVSAKVEGSTEEGIVSGQRSAQEGKPQLALRYLSKGANLKKGQKVYSSGLGGIFPAGIPLGQIEKFTPGQFDGMAVLEPAVNFSSLRDVFVIVGER